MSRFLCIGLVLLCVACTSLRGAISPPSPGTDSTSFEHKKRPETPGKEGEEQQRAERNAEGPALSQGPMPCAEAQSAASTAACYHLTPGSPPLKNPKTGKIIRPGRMCQPQSLIYARCRSGIQTCKLGNTSPEGWFACAQKAGGTTATPQAGSVMVFAANTKRKMYTGHPVYVEKACRHGDGTWQLTISHTNYDRQCHLDANARVSFDPRTMTASFETGPWASWAKRLRVLGFILR